MKLYKSKGIVFRSLKYRETSLILDIYTLEKGLKSFIVNGIRSGKSKSKSNIYQPMNILSLVAYEKENAGLSRIKECKHGYIYQDLVFNVHKSSIAMVLIEIARNSITESEDNQELYQFLEDWLIFLDQTTEKTTQLVVLFLVELSAFLGFAPQNNYAADSPYFDLREGRFQSSLNPSSENLEQDSSLLLNRVLLEKKEDIHKVDMESRIRHKLFNALLMYYKIHIDNFKEPKSLNILRQILR